MSKKSANPNEAVMYEALQAAKQYISAEGTGKPRRSKNEVLKKIRAALAPKEHIYKERIRNLEQLRKIAEEIDEELNEKHYRAALGAMPEVRRLKLDNYYYEVYSLVRKLQSAIDKLKL